MQCVNLISNLFCLFFGQELGHLRVHESILAQVSFQICFILEHVLHRLLEHIIIRLEELQNELLVCIEPRVQLLIELLHIHLEQLDVVLLHGLHLLFFVKIEEGLDTIESPCSIVDVYD